MLTSKPLAGTMTMVMGCAVFAAGIAVAPSASAYPPGKNMTVATNKSVYQIKKGKKSRVIARSTQVFPGCTVRFVLKGKTITKNRRLIATKKGRARAVFARGARKPGRYTVTATSSGVTALGKTCPKEKAKTTFRVRKN